MSLGKVSFLSSFHMDRQPFVLIHKEACCVCKEDFCLPSQLSCDHIVCFYCISQMIKYNKSDHQRFISCPLCRKHTTIKDLTFPIRSNLTPPVWIYQGRNNGWWVYDGINRQQIEKSYVSYVSNTDNNEIVISAGPYKYTINFKNMIQTSQYNGAQRNIFRVVDEGVFKSFLIKGISGIPITIRPDIFNLDSPERKHIFSVDNH